MTTAYRPTTRPSGDTVPPHVKRWTKAEYNALVDRGVFSGQRLYLFRGELIEMAPMGSPHARGIAKAAKVLFAVFDPTRLDIRVQSPFDVPGESMPEPDLLVCTIEAGVRLPHPNEAMLVIEVSDSSLIHDRETALEYAAARVPEYWIINLAARNVEVYRNPVPDRSALLGFRYPPPTILRESETVTPLSLAGVTVKVLDLLP